MSPELATCPECDGAGEVSWNVSRDPQCVESATCPTCHGTGADDA